MPPPQTPAPARICRLSAISPVLDTVWRYLSFCDASKEGQGVNDIERRADHPLSSLPRPFLRWAGSKQRLLPSITPRLPESFSNYIEPFIGAGSIFFLLQPDRALLADSNQALIETYRAVRDNPKKILEYLEHFDPLDKDLYYEIRSREYAGRFQRAAQFIYLNRAGWNGLYRVNSKGEFNVPYGNPKTANLVEPTVLLSCSVALRKSGVELAVQDFRPSLSVAAENDLVFLDPPYVTGHNNNGFVDYNEKLFSWNDQIDLAKLAKSIHAAGSHVLVTNAHHETLLSLYDGFQYDLLSRHSTLASLKAHRRPTNEVLLWKDRASKTTREP